MSANLKNVVLIDKGKVVGGDTLRPHLVISATTGATVIVKKGVKAVRATETSTGVFECDVPEFGTWVVNINGADGVSVVIDKVKIYQIGTNTKEPRDITNELSSLSQAIAEQDLEKYGYKIGDYFLGTEQTPYVYTLADLDTFYGGYEFYAVVGTHHIGVVVDTKTTSRYLDSGTLTGYKTSTLHTYLTGTVLTNIKADLTALFGSWSDHLVAHDKLYPTVSSWEWSSSGQDTEYISALTESQVYGNPVFSGTKYQQGEGDKQLEIFRKWKYNKVFGNVGVWLRSIYTSSVACFFAPNGSADGNNIANYKQAVGLILLK